MYESWTYAIPGYSTALMLLLSILIGVESCHLVGATSALGMALKLSQQNEVFLPARDTMLLYTLASLLHAQSNPGSNSETTTTLNLEAIPYNPPTTSILWTYSGKHVFLQTTVCNPD